MKKFALVPILFVAALAAFSTRAQANSVDVVVTGTYASTATTTAFSAPGATITFSFSLPMNIGPTLTVGSVPITIGFGGTSTSVTDVLTFFPSANGGGFNIDVPSFGGQSWEWEFLGGQLFDSSFNLLTGTFTASSAQLILNGLPSGAFSSASVALSTSTAPTPEPASLLLLGTGLLGLGFVMRRRWPARM